MNQTILKEKPRLLGPRLVCLIGQNEAILLQQIQYWISPRRSKNVFNGRRWVYKTYDDWVIEFPFWSKKTVERTLASLKAQNLILGAFLSVDKRDRTVWYSVNEEAIELLQRKLESAESSSSSLNCGAAQRQNDAITHRQNDALHGVKMTRCNKEQRILSENTTNKKTNKKDFPEPVDNFFFDGGGSKKEEAFESFWKLYPVKIDKKAAKEAFLSGRCHLTIGLILKSLESQILEKSEKERLGMFSPPWKHPKRWLKGECWNNPVEEIGEIRRQSEIQNRSRMSVRKRNGLEEMESVKRELAEMLRNKKVGDEGKR